MVGEVKGCELVLGDGLGVISMLEMVRMEISF